MDTKPSEIETAFAQIDGWLQNIADLYKVDIAILVERLSIKYLTELPNPPIEEIEQK